MSWTAEKEGKLRELWGKGKTASQIALIIGEVSRNAVIGKAHRLNLARKTVNRSTTTKTTNNLKNTRETRVSRKSRFKSLLLDKNFEPENPKSLEQLNEKTCKWPTGHPNEENFYFCGRHPIKGFSYCKLHVLYAFQPKNMKDDEIDVEDIPKFIEKKIKSA
tara:strand:+ start:354 stop:839 length:486 start_codon:yes stop_codon:yes gene_type:complete